MFSIDFISGFILFSSEEFIHVHACCLSIFRAKLSSLSIICSLDQVKLSLDKYLMTINLSLGLSTFAISTHLGKPTLTLYI